MSNLNNYNYVNDDDEVKAEDPNELMASSFVSRFKNIEVLSGTRTLEDLDTPIQNFDCDGSDRDVKMPTPNAVTNHPFWIVNASAGAQTITIKSNDDVDTLGTIAQGAARLFLPDGAGAYLLVGDGGSSGGGGTLLSTVWVAG